MTLRRGPVVPLNDLGAQRRSLGSSLEDALGNVLDHMQFIMGPEVGQLEEAMADYTGASHVVSCSSGTDALVMTLMAWGVGLGDAVFVPTFSFAASAEAAALVGATPVFVDVLPDTFNIDPQSLSLAAQDVLRSGLRPTAVIAVDLFGQPANYAPLFEIASKHSMRVLADSAQSFGATLHGRPVGTLADVTATSFFPAKPFGCYGDGGAVFTNDPDVADLVRSIRVHGRGANKYQTTRVGLNARLDTIQAAVLLQKLRIFPDEIELRASVAERYTQGLKEFVTVPMLTPGATSVWAQYTVCCKDRDSVARNLQRDGIASAVYYPIPLHKQPAYVHCPRSPSGLAVGEQLARHVLSLPMHPYLDETSQDQVIDSLRSACRILSRDSQV